MVDLQLDDHELQMLADLVRFAHKVLPIDPDFQDRLYVKLVVEIQERGMYGAR